MTQFFNLQRRLEHWNIREFNENRKLKINSRSGQSLVEIMIGLGIGAVLIGAASIGVTFMLKSSTASQNYQKGGQLAEGLFDKVDSWASADWQNIYGLTKGTSTKYFLNSSSTALFAVQGQEGMLDNDVTNGLVGEWKFDEDSTTTSTITYDSTGNSNNGTLACSGSGCSLPQRITGKISNALNFLSSTSSVYSYVNFPSSVPTSSQITVTAWYQWNGDTGDDRIVNRGWCSSMGWLMHRYYGFGVNDATGCSAQYWASFGTLSQGTWYFLAGVFDGTSTYAYKDGVLNATTLAPSVTLGSNNYAINLMTQNNGYLDDVRIYNRALSATEVGNLYRSTFFSRYFTVENVCRTNNSSSSISSVAPCGGSDINDPSTQKVSVYANWSPNTTGSPQIKLSNYITRWQNQVFNQTDWSGGAGVDGPLTNPSSRFSTGTNIDATSTPGSIRILNLTPP